MPQTLHSVPRTVADFPKEELAVLTETVCCVLRKVAAEKLSWLQKNSRSLRPATASDILWLGHRHYGDVPVPLEASLVKFSMPWDSPLVPFSLSGSLWEAPEILYRGMPCTSCTIIGFCCIRLALDILMSIYDFECPFSTFLAPAFQQT